MLPSLATKATHFPITEGSLAVLSNVKWPKSVAWAAQIWISYSTGGVWASFGSGQVSALTMTPSVAQPFNSFRPSLFHP